MKVIFWNTDTQKDFINKDGALYVEGAESIRENLQILTNAAKKFNITVVNTADYHGKDTEEISSKPDFKTTFPPHCMAGTVGADFITETSPNCNYGDNYYIVGWDNKKIDFAVLKRARNIIIQKDKFDVFEGNKHTSQILASLAPSIVIVYGVTTQICVNFAVLGLAKRYYKIIVAEDAIKELPNLPSDNIKENWKKEGVLLRDTDFIVNEFLI